MYALRIGFGLGVMALGIGAILYVIILAIGD